MPLPQRSAIAVRHVAFENLGLLSAILDRAGWAVAYCDASVNDLTDPSIAKADLLIVLGGPIGVYETAAYPFLNRELAVLERRLTRDLPTLGICLGSQLMACALGGRVFPGAVKEIGWGPLTLTPAGKTSCLQALGVGANVLHWHGDTFELPDGTTRLASTANYENQAFAYGKNCLGLQFHLEADPGRLEEWYVGHAVELAAAGISVQTLRSATAEVAGSLQRQAEAVFGRWLNEISWASRSPALIIPGWCRTPPAPAVVHRNHRRCDRDPPGAPPGSSISYAPRRPDHACASNWQG
jgi:GMP synthase (glutamine-hydrolysing)